MGYLTTAEVAELLHVKPDTVRKWRQEVGKGPRWTRWPGTRLVRYESAEVERWRHACVLSSWSRPFRRFF